MALSAPETRPYHHGDLRRALIDAALDLAERHGAERVTLREVARQLGVSAAAPFRHFASRKALMTAVGVEANERLALEMRRALARAGASPLARLRALSRGYVGWALRHAGHFRIVSARDELDVDGTPALQAGMHALRDLTEDTVRAAQAAGELRPGDDAERLALLARAAAYGLARMHHDDHFRQWGVAPGREAEAMEETLNLLLSMMARR